MTFMAACGTSARSAVTPAPEQHVRIYVGKRRAASAAPSAVNAQLAGYISGRLSPLLGTRATHNVNTCADCAVVVQ
ncbi:MAG: hypothetical protein KGL10_06365 [Alphaproteobacteria bacterium]|nr:hypothetical protein [Alphaproteobacteria bacterium]MDE2336917.1 hypothetical protein [Alphaproteobacteria bacterium]